MANQQRTIEAILTDMLGVDSVTGLQTPNKSTGGAAQVAIKSNDVLPPENSKYTDTLNILIATASTVTTSGDTSGYSHGVIQVTSMSVLDTLLIQGYLDAAQTKLSDAILLYSTAGVAVTASAIAAAGTFYLRDSAFNGFKVTKTGANATATIEFSLKS